MTVPFQINYATDMTLGYTKLFSKLALGDCYDGFTATNFLRNSIRQLVTRMAVLQKTICDVVFWRSSEQVIWIAAWRIIAAMQNPFSIWHLAMLEFERDAMGAERSIIPVYLSVAIGSYCPGPRPTFIGLSFLNSCPEFLFKRKFILPPYSSSKFAYSLIIAHIMTVNYLPE